jgi:hypothetical protein
MASDNHIFTNDFRNLSRKLSRRGVRNPGQAAMKKIGVEKAVKKRFHDYYLEKKMSVT